MRRFIGHPLVGLITGAAVIRLAGIFTRGIQYDDAFSIMLSGRPINEIFVGTAADTMPPLFYVILHFWQKMGTSIAFLRLPGILFSLGIIYLAYRIVEKVENRQAAIWTAAILAVSPLQYYHAQDIRMYSLATFMILGWTWGMIELVHQHNLRGFPAWKWVVLILSGAGALYSHALAGFGLIAPFVFLMLRRDWKRLSAMIAAGSISILLYIPWLVLVPGQIAKVQQAFWTPVPGAVEIMQAIIMAFGDIPASSIAMGIALFSAIAIVLISCMVLRKTRTKDNNLLLFALMILIPTVSLFGLSYLMRPMFVPRAFLSAYVGLAAFLGVLVSRSSAVEKCLIGVFIAVSSIFTLPTSIHYNKFPRSPFMEANRFIASEINVNGVILHDNKLSYFPSKVYAPGLNSRFLKDAAGSANDTLAEKTLLALDMTAYDDVNTAIYGFERVFFVVFAQTLEEYGAIGENHPVLKELKLSAGNPIEHRFGDLLVLEYSVGDTDE